MALIGTVSGLLNGMTAQNFTRAAAAGISAGSGLFASIVAVAFAYEGWIIATSINAELRNAKRNLPRALVAGSLVVVFVYIFYYVGLAGAVPTEKLMESGQTGAKLAFQNIFGAVGGSLLFVFVIVSCLGTLNGLMMGNVRGLFALSARGRGPRPDILSQLDRTTNVPTNSAIAGLILAGFWLLYFYGANLADPVWFGPFCFDTSELPIITLYAGYIPIFIMFMMKERAEGAVRRILLPLLSILGCVFMVVAACLAHGRAVVFYLIIFLVFMLPGVFFRRKAAELHS
jgi:APA family basic amino acid/polyamine antiporter